MTEALLILILENAAFLDRAAGETIDPEVAASELEAFVARLRTLPDADRAALTRFARQRAAAEPHAGRRAFFTAFASRVAPPDGEDPPR